jgi:hypothetical protein
VCANCDGHPENPDEDTVESGGTAANSGWAFDAHGMVRHIFVKVREDEQ